MLSTHLHPSDASVIVAAALHSGQRIMRNSTFHIPTPAAAVAMTATTAPAGANPTGALTPRHAC